LNSCVPKQIFLEGVEQLKKNPKNPKNLSWTRN